MAKIIRLFMAVAYSFAFAVSAPLANTGKTELRDSSSHYMRAASARHEQKSARGQVEGDDKEAACPLCIDPCALKRNVEKGLVKVTDARGKKIEKFWVIDARPGIHQPCTDKEDTYYVSSPRTRVYIINMNPFVFDYEITKLEQGVPETAQITFLKLLGPPLSDAIGNAGGTGTKASESQTLTDQECQNEINQANAFLNEVDKTLTDLEKEYENFHRAFEGVREAYASLLDTEATCQELCRYMNSFKEHYAVLPNKYVFEDLVLKVIKENPRVVADFKKAFPNVDNCSGRNGRQLQDRLARMRRRFDILNDELNVLCNNLFKANRAKLAAMNEAIDTVRKHPELLLRQSFDVGGYSEATRVTISVEPKVKQLAERFPEDMGTGPQPCAAASGGQGGQQGGQQSGQKPGGGTPPQQPVTEAPPSPSPTPTP